MIRSIHVTWLGLMALVLLSSQAPDAFAQGRGGININVPGSTGGGNRPSINVGPGGVTVGPSNPGYAPGTYAPGTYAPGTYNPGGYYRSGYPAGTYVTPPNSVYVPNSTIVTAPAPVPVAAAQDRAVMNVRVPANARVFIGNTETTGQSGSTRQFVSPPLQGGNAYQYELRAQWTENGQTVDRTRKVTIHAGDRITVDFLQGS